MSLQEAIQTANHMLAEQEAHPNAPISWRHKAAIAKLVHLAERKLYGSEVVPR